MNEIRTDVSDRVAVVTLDAPARRNALNLAMCEEVVATFDDLESRDDVGAVIITGAPPAFCAGADLSQLGASKREGLKKIYEGFLRIARCPLPTLAAVNGAAVGAGMNLALACDLRLAGARARFDTRFLDLALHPGGGHTWMFQRITGPQPAIAAVLFGEVLDAGEAERVGLVWRTVDDGMLMDLARRLAQQAADGPPELVRKIKQTLRDVAAIDSHDEAVERELEPQVWSMEQPEFKERIAALQRRISGR